MVKVESQDPQLRLSVSIAVLVCDLSSQYSMQLKLHEDAGCNPSKPGHAPVTLTTYHSHTIQLLLYGAGGNGCENPVTPVINA